MAFRKNSGVKQYFTPDEIEEVGLIKELLQGTTIEGEPILGFDLLWNLLHETRLLAEVPKEELLKAYVHIQGYNKHWSHAEWFDTSKSATIEDKFRKIVNDELRSRP
jgi:hypothetical protein